jgi:hypothetical protein
VNKKFFSIIAMAIGIFALTFAVVSAAVTFDPATGTGFVGKGDVQNVYGWNNPQLQANANNVQFRVQSEIVTETSWTCTNESNQNEQVRERTTTSTVQGVVTSVARERNQVTGFYISGYAGEPVVDSSTDGPQLNSCPSGPWTLTEPAGEPEVVSSTGGVQVSTDGINWYTLN